MGSAKLAWVCGVLLTTALACSGDDPEPRSAERDPDGATARRDGGTDGRSDAGSLPLDRNSLACNPLAVATLGTCSPAQIEQIGDCLEQACKAELATCYGPAYARNEFSGPCAEQGVCNSKCACRDEACYGACPVSDACTSCARSFVTCGSQCVGSLGCAFDDAGMPSGGLVDVLAGACDELKSCCDRMTDPVAKSECTQAHAQVRESGGFLCALVIPLYCS